MANKPSQVPAPNLSSMTDQERRSYLMSIMGDTLETLQKGDYINSKREKITLDLNPAVVSLTPFQFPPIKAEERKGQYNTLIFLNHKDCLTVVRDCIQNGLNPICLDAASEERFGGGYKTGARAISRCHWPNC